jgi:ABC-2 type transport system permease protein
MSRWLSATRGCAWRVIHHMTHNPAFLLPSIIFPMFFFIAFAGGLSSIGDIPAFDYEPGYTAFQFVFVLLQSAAFGGVFTGFTIAGDFERGFARRLLLATPHRSAIFFGYAIAAMFRAAIVGSLLFVVAVLTGMPVQGDGVDLGGLILLAVAVNFVATCFGGGVAMRLRTMQAGPAMQMPVFLLLFLAPVYVPRELLQGWIEGVAAVNPVTALLEAGRALLAGDAVQTGVLLAVVGGLVVVMGLWALRGLRSAEAAG